MSSQRALWAVSRLGSTAWVMALAYLALAQPTHAAAGSEPGESLLRVAGAVVAAALFLARKPLKRVGRRVLARIPDRRASLAAVSLVVAADPTQRS
jgi:hypothetical protein